MRYDDTLFIQAAHAQARRLLESGYNTIKLLSDLATPAGEQGIVIEAFGTKLIGEANTKAFAKLVRELIRLYIKTSRVEVNIKEMYIDSLWQETHMCAVETLRSCLESERGEKSIDRLYTEMKNVKDEVSTECWFETFYPDTGQTYRKRLVKTVLYSKSGEFTGLLFALISTGKSISFSIAGHVGSHYFEFGDAYKVKAMAYRMFEAEKKIKDANVSCVSELKEQYLNLMSFISQPVDGKSQTVLNDDVKFIEDINRMQRDL